MQDKIIPNLMPFQMDPFNGDTYVEKEFLALRDRLGITTVIETGTCLGGTTVWLFRNFQTVCTIESNEDFQRIAIERCANDILELGAEKILHFKLGHSEECLGEVIDTFAANNKTLFFLDAHWEQSCPLLRELEIIGEKGLKPIIVIHDFYVPGLDLQYDTYNGQRFDYPWIKSRLDKIYGPTGYLFFYNVSATGAKVGVIYIIPIT